MTNARIRGVPFEGRPDKMRVYRTVEGCDTFLGVLTLVNDRYYPSLSGPAQVSYRPTHSYRQRTNAIRHLMFREPQEGGIEVEHEPRSDSRTVYGKELSDEED